MQLIKGMGVAHIFEQSFLDDSYNVAFTFCHTDRSCCMRTENIVYKFYTQTEFCLKFDFRDKSWFSPVVSEVVLPSEGFVADITGVWSLVCVRPLMDQKVVGFGKMAATELADKLFFGLGGQSASAGLAFW